MFPLPSDTIDQALERARRERLRAMRANRAQSARLDQEFSELVREADDHGDWRAAGCSSNAQWVAQLSHSDYRTAERITSTGLALRALPEIDRKFRAGELSIDQTAAAVANATPATDAEIAELAPGKAPGEIALAVRRLNPPTVAEDQAAYRRRAFRMTWTDDRSELVVTGRLPHELGVVFESAIREIAKAKRAAAKQTGETLEWQQATADALVTLARRHDTDSGHRDRTVRRSSTTTIVHLSDDGAPAMLEGGGPISGETAERLICGSRILFIKPHGTDLVHSRAGRCASYPQLRAMFKRSGHCQYPGCTTTHDLEAHHITPFALGGATETDNLVLECGRHHTRIHDHHIRISGTGANPIYTSADGHLITAAQPHAPPG